MCVAVSVGWCLSVAEESRGGAVFLSEGGREGGEVVVAAVERDHGDGQLWGGEEEFGGVLESEVVEDLHGGGVVVSLGLSDECGDGHAGFGGHLWEGPFAS